MVDMKELYMVDLMVEMMVLMREVTMGKERVVNLEQLLDR